MRIAFFTNNYLPRPSGVAHSIENLRIELENLGHKVFIFAPRYSKKDKDSDKVFHYKSIRLNKKMGFLQSIPFPHSVRLKKKIKNLRLDIIHSHHPFFLGKTALKYAKELGIPLVFTIHTPYYQYWEKILGGLGEMLSPLVIEKNIHYANQCEAVIMPTSLMAKVFRNHGLRAPIWTIPSGINMNLFTHKITKQSAKKRLGLEKQEFVLLTIGRLSFERRVDFLLEAFALLNKKISRGFLVIVGGGFEQKSLERLASFLGIKDRVWFTGTISYKKLPLFYQAAHIFIYSSLIDSQGLVLCEAMASGLPIISTNQAMGPRAIIKDGKTGYLVKPDTQVFCQKIIDLMKHQKKLQELSQNALIEAKIYDRHALAQKMADLYQKTITSYGN